MFLPGYFLNLTLSKISLLFDNIYNYNDIWSIIFKTLFDEIVSAGFVKNSLIERALDTNPKVLGSNFDLATFSFSCKCVTRMKFLSITIIMINYWNVITCLILFGIPLSAIYSVELFQITDQMSLSKNCDSANCASRICPD